MSKKIEEFGREIMAALEPSRAWMAEPEIVEIDRYRRQAISKFRGHSPNITDGGLCYTHRGGWYKLLDGEFDTAAMLRWMAERDGELEFNSIRPAYQVMFGRAVRFLVKSGQLELAYPDDGFRIVRRAKPTDTDLADSTGDRGRGVGQGQG
jgi:hypothetical protein